MSMNDVVKAALEVQGKKKALLHQPVFIGKLIGSLPDILPVCLRCRPTPSTSSRSPRWRTIGGCSRC